MELRYNFGSYDEIVNKMLEGYREGSDVLRVYQQFANSVKNSPKVALGVNLAWELAIYDVASLPGAVPMLAFMMGMLFEDVMTSLLSDDPAFLAEVLRVRQEVLNSN